MVQGIKINGWNVIRFVTKTVMHALGSGLRLNTKEEVAEFGLTYAK